MSANNSHEALATLDLIERLGRFRARLHVLGRTSDLAELDKTIEQARLELMSLRTPSDSADQDRYAELITELRGPWQLVAKQSRSPLNLLTA